MKLVILAAFVAAASAKCANDCSGHGLCNVFSSCECYRNWMGNDCSRRLCYFGRAFVDTPQGDLNSNGQLDTAAVPSRMANNPTFEDFPLDYADGAGAASSWSEAHFYAECSNKGTCDRSTGLCECWPGYEGSGCARLACPSATAGTCSGHGTCAMLSDFAVGTLQYNGWDQDKTQRCVCDPGYTGIKCDQRVCPSGDDPITKFVKLTTVCLKMETAQTNPVHQAEMPINGYTAKTKVFGSKSGATGILMTKTSNEWKTIVNGKAENLKEKAGCALVGDVRGEFVVGEKLMVGTTGASLAAKSHPEEALVVKSISKATYTDKKQVNEQQRISFTPTHVQSTTFDAASGPAPVDTKFALTFEDEFGQSYTTRTINGGMSQPGKIMDLMADIEAALEELPNAVVPNVQMYLKKDHSDVTYTTACASGGEFPSNANVQFVSGFTWANSGAYASGLANNADQNYCDFFAIDVLFVSNSGKIPVLSVYTPEGHNNFYNVEVASAVEGTTENALCSNRGACDYATGECKCYQGFTGHDCSRQNVLAMY